MQKLRLDGNVLWLRIDGDTNHCKFGSGCILSKPLSKDESKPTESVVGLWAPFKGVETRRAPRGSASSTEGNSQYPKGVLPLFEAKMRELVFEQMVPLGIWFEIKVIRSSAASDTYSHSF